MEEMLSGKKTDSEIISSLHRLQSDEVSAQELAACLDVMLEKSTNVAIEKNPLIDICGTGGDGKNTFNISTTVAFVLSGAGVAVAKHGNRASSSRCGSADVWEMLGLKLLKTASEVSGQIETFNLGFLFAPAFHPALSGVAPARKKLGTRTVFNLLGPLANPAHVTHQLIGVYSPHMVPRVAEVLRHKKEPVNAMVVSSESGMDELSLEGSNRIAHLSNGKISEYNVTPKDFGLEVTHTSDALQGGDAAENAQILLEILKGTDRGPRRDAVMMNASAAFVVVGKATTFEDGVALARTTLESGKAFKVYKRLRDERENGIEFSPHH
jgi:anthranilate phosphoribosyltransferase